jgi:hypothetical protein
MAGLKVREYDGHDKPGCNPNGKQFDITRMFGPCRLNLKSKIKIIGKCAFLHLLQCCTASIYVNIHI